MGDISPVIIAACGLSIVCIGLILIGGFLLLRFTGANIFAPLLGALMGASNESDDEDEYTPRRKRSAADSPARRIRKSTVPDDFDAAVERYRQGGQPSSSHSLRRPSPLSGSLDDDTSSGSIRHDRSRDRDRGEGEEFYDDDEGGFFDL